MNFPHVFGAVLAESPSLWVGEVLGLPSLLSSYALHTECSTEVSGVLVRECKQ